MTSGYFSVRIRKYRIAYISSNMPFSPTIKEITLDTKINGNDFSGNAISNSDANVAKVGGKFYGNNAKELAGIAVADDNLKAKEQGWGVGLIAGKTR